MNLLARNSARWLKLNYHKRWSHLVALHTMDILTLGWVAVLVLYTWSISMVIWGRNGL